MMWHGMEGKEDDDDDDEGSFQGTKQSKSS